jgi:hypothetical protein
MSKLFSSIVFSLFLLFQTTSLAEGDTPPAQTNVEEPEAQESEPTEQETQPEAAEEVEPKEEISEAEKEAQAAEEAELREAGVGEEPVPD